MVIPLVHLLPPVYPVNKDGSTAYVHLTGPKYKTAKKVCKEEKGLLVY